MNYSGIYAYVQQLAEEQRERGECITTDWRRIANMYPRRSGFESRSYTVDDVDWSLSDEMIRKMRDELRFLEKKLDAHQEELQQPKPIKDSDLLRILET